MSVPNFPAMPGLHQSGPGREDELLAQFASKKDLMSKVLLAQVLGLRPRPNEAPVAFFTRVDEYAKQFVHPSGETLYDRANLSKG